MRYVLFPRPREEAGATGMCDYGATCVSGEAGDLKLLLLH